MTTNKRQRLRVDLGDWDGNTAYAKYDNFSIGSYQEKYQLASVGRYLGTAGRKLNSVRFATFGVVIQCLRPGVFSGNFSLFRGIMTLNSSCHRRRR